MPSGVKCYIIKDLHMQNAPCVCVCVHATGITGMYRTGLEVCVNMQKYIYKIGQVDDGRLEGAGRT